MRSASTRCRLAALLLWLFAGLVAPIRAGGNAGAITGIEKFGAPAIERFATKLNETLDAKRINLAIIARAGRPRTELPRGVSYTHVAFVVFEPVVGRDGAVFHTYTVYNLYQGGPGEEVRGLLKQDFTHDFVAGAVEPDVAVCVPPEALQQRIVRVIRSPAYRELFTPAYNVLANPWVDRFDNCATHLLKVCVAAIYQTAERERIYANIRAYFQPTRVQLGVLKTIASSSLPELRREDMDPAGWQTATYDSLKAFLEGNGLVKEAFVVRME